MTQKGGKNHTTNYESERLEVWANYKRFKYVPENISSHYLQQ